MTRKLPFVICLFLVLFVLARVAKCENKPATLSQEVRVIFFENAFRQQTLARTQDNLQKLYATNQSKQKMLADEWSVLEKKTLTEMGLDPKTNKIDFDSESNLVIEKIPVQDSPAPTK